MSEAPLRSAPFAESATLRVERSIEETRDGLRLGHHEPGVTLDTYGHLIEGADAAAARAIATVMGTPAEQ